VVDWQGSEVGFFWWRAWRGGRVSERVHVKRDESGRRVCGLADVGCGCGRGRGRGSAARVKMREVRRQDSGGKWLGEAPPRRIRDSARVVER
jgi:hypothetical protein